MHKMLDQDGLVVAHHSARARAPAEQSRRIERLYREHWKVLCIRLRRVFGDGPPEPEDLVQVAFARVIERTDIDEIKDPCAYLFRIAINAGRDRQRHIAQTRRLIEQQLGPLEGDRLDQITPSNVYESKERLSVTIAAMGGLSVKQRDILVRSRLKGETFDQIHAATGWSKADISRTMQAALAVLQRAMRAAYGDDGEA